MIKIETTVWLNEIKQLNGFSVIKAAHKTRRKNERGDWETTSTEYVDILIDDSKKSQFDHVFRAQIPQRAALTGSAKPNGFLRKDGEVGVTLNVYPESIELLDAPVQATPQYNEDEVPF